MSLETKIHELTKELEHNLNNSMGGSNYFYVFLASSMKTLFFIYRLLKTETLSQSPKFQKLRAVVLYVILFLRKHLIKNTHGNFSTSEEGRLLKEIIINTYDRPLHIINMTEELINSDIGRYSLTSLGYYRETHVPNVGVFGYIVVEEGLSIDRQVLTLVHELVHAKFQPSRSNDNAKLYARNEVVAESVAYVVCAALGVPVDRKHCENYVLGYLSQAKKEQPLEAMMKDVYSTTIEVLEYLSIMNRRQHYTA